MRHADEPVSVDRPGRPSCRLQYINSRLQSLELVTRRSMYGGHQQQRCWVFGVVVSGLDQIRMIESNSGTEIGRMNKVGLNFNQNPSLSGASHLYSPCRLPPRFGL